MEYQAYWLQDCWLQRKCADSTVMDRKKAVVSEKFLYVIDLGEMTCLNLPDQSASLLSGPPSWSKVLNQPVTAQRNWLQRNSCTSHWSR